MTGRRSVQSTRPLCRGRHLAAGGARSAGVLRIHAIREVQQEAGRSIARLATGRCSTFSDRHAQLPRLHLEQARRPQRHFYSRRGPARLAQAGAGCLRRHWKVIAADLPIGLISEDAIALGNGPPDRREHEIAELLSFIKRAASATPFG